MDTLRHLQLVILSIMKDVDALCKKNHIEYYLLGGSAIGAVRHQGFIPWDDDLDIMMTPSNYQRFIEVCRSQLNPEKYYLQVGLEDWPLNFTKVRLLGTKLEEHEGYSSTESGSGIYLDVFKLENAPSNRLSQIYQYVLAKYFLCYQLSERTFKSASLKKKCMMILSLPLKNKWLRHLVKRQIEKYGDDSEYYGSFYFRTRLKNAFTRKDVMGTPLYKPFENIELPIPEKYDAYLTQMFGDYMTPPPVEQQVGLHLIDVDFGDY